MKHVLLSRKGFTLMELLIVVAIIGVLATMGYPTYRKMMAKARKSEAKMALGGLFTSESAFFSEYNQYMNNVNLIGFDVTGGAGQIYTVGFPDGGVCNPATAIIPAAGAGTTLDEIFPNNYAQPNVSLVGPGVAADVCFDVIGVDVAQDFNAAATQFRASATGPIRNAITRATSVAAACGVECQDVWTINNNRVLANPIDGAAF